MLSEARETVALEREISLEDEPDRIFDAPLRDTLA
jgi:hypothetical protein